MSRFLAEGGGEPWVVLLRPYQTAGGGCARALLAKSPTGQILACDLGRGCLFIQQVEVVTAVALVKDAAVCRRGKEERSMREGQ